MFSLNDTGTYPVSKWQFKKVAKAFIQGTHSDSNYRRIQRFLQQVTLDYHQIAVLLLNLFDIDKAIISIDRTNWQWGKKNLNIFMLSVVHKGIAIPVYWELLDKKGNSNSLERIELVQQFIDQFGKDKIETILADREFIGRDWLTWLDNQGINFCIRIKKNTKVTNRHGKDAQVHKLFRSLNQYETLILKRTVKVHGCQVKLSAKRVQENELLIVATNDFNEHQAIALYAKRWEIETLFSCFKSRGFGLEDTHLNHQERMKKLVAVFSIAFCWCYKLGIQQNVLKPIKRKNHGRLEKSLFRLGLDWFQSTLRHFMLADKADDYVYLHRLLRFLQSDFILVADNFTAKE